MPAVHWCRQRSRRLVRRARIVRILRIRSASVRQLVRMLRRSAERLVDRAHDSAAAAVMLRMDGVQRQRQPLELHTQLAADGRIGHALLQLVPI
jgi:hypothetical protein